MGGILRIISDAQRELSINSDSDYPNLTAQPQAAADSGC